MHNISISMGTWMILLSCVIIAFLYAAIEHALSHKKDASSLPHRYCAIAMCVAIALVATVISKCEKYVGAPMLAMLLGVIVVNCAPSKYIKPEFRAGTAYVGKKYLSLGIVCLGATLSVTNLFSASDALPLVIFNVCLSFAVSLLIGKKVLRVSRNTSLLVGSGTCVCGGTAIAAVSPIIKAKEEETAYAMTAIFLFDLLACLSYPYLAIRMGLTDVQFGFLAGTAINDTSSVVAAQETFAALRGYSNYALPATIKVVRTSMIIVLAVVFSLLSARSEGAENSSQENSILKTIWKALPKFILFFIGTVILNTLLSVNVANSVFYTQWFKPFFSTSYKFFVTVALAGVGSKIRLGDLFSKGMRPIILGGCTWLALFISSLAFSLLFV